MVDVVDEVTGTVEHVTIPNPPWPYARRAKGGIVVLQKNKDGQDIDPLLVYAHDMYPMRRMVNERHDTEQTVWRVQLPIVGWVEITIDQASLAESTTLHGILLSKGVYVPPAGIKIMVSFMVAYITQLQKEARTERLFSKLGWREENSLFVLDDRIYRKGGRVDTHQVSSELRNEIPGMRREGTLQGWKDAIQFYNAPGHEAHRFMLYGAFGAPLFHMTGHHGAIINAAGPTGIGKTTVLYAISSVWGHPKSMVVSGTKSGTTPNALHSLLSVYNSLPFCLDEITRIDQKVLGDFCLSVSQGQGKRRNVRSGMLSRLIETWATLVYTSANTDAYIALMQNRRDASAEAMRVLQLMFTATGYTKEEADRFINEELMMHYGHAGHVYAPYIVEKNASIQDTLRKVVVLTDQKGKVTTAERFHSGAVSSHIVGAMGGRKCGLLEDFPIERDWEWAIDQIAEVRSSMKDHHASPKEILSEFLEARVSETLVISQTLQPNIAPRIDQIPRGALSIRHEVDAGIIFLLKSELKRYCIETGANYGAIQESLLADQVLLDADAKKVLGAGTDFGKGQVRCWLIDVKKL